jgi:predicted transcriptional regulator
MSRTNEDLDPNTTRLSRGEAEAQCLLLLVARGATTPESISNSLGLSPALHAAVGQALRSLVDCGRLEVEDEGDYRVASGWRPGVYDIDITMM